MTNTYGNFTKEDGHVSGHVLTIKTIRKDGKFTVIHAYGSGKQINKIYTLEQLQEQISKFTGTIDNQIKFY
jgi:hypothetical protein